jgi:hypothetical protein
MIAQFFQGESTEHVFRMRYQANTIRVWFARRDQAAVGMVPLAEAPVPKDGWTSPDAGAVTYPPMVLWVAHPRVYVAPWRLIVAMRLTRHHAE